MKRSLTVILAMLIMGVCASAQSLLVQEKSYERFTQINVEDNFILKFYKGNDYSVTLKTDERIAAHVLAYVKNGVLYLALDEKGYSPELKKELRQRGVPAPVLEAEIYIPELNSVVFKDKVVVAHCDRFTADTFTMTASDNSLVSQFNVECSTAEINVSRNAQITASFDVTSKLYVKAGNSTQVSITQNGGNAFVSQSGSSYVDLKAYVNTLEIETNSGSETHMSGSASLMNVTGAGLSRIDTELLEATDGIVTLTGSAKCYVNVTNNLKVNLTGGSMLTFKRNPSFEIERIVNSTLVKAEDAKRK